MTNFEGAMVGGVTTTFGGVDVVPLQGAIVVWCHCSVRWLGGG